MIFFQWEREAVVEQFFACCSASVSQAKEKEDLWSPENSIWVYPRKWIDKMIIVNIRRDDGCVTE